MLLQISNRMLKIMQQPAVRAHSIRLCMKGKGVVFFAFYFKKKMNFLSQILLIRRLNKNNRLFFAFFISKYIQFTVKIVPFAIAFWAIYRMWIYIR